MEIQKIPDQLQVFKYPSNHLKLVARDYDFVEDAKKEDTLILCHRLIGAMIKYDGLSIAATQCGLDYRIFVVNPDYLHAYDGGDKRPNIYINPIITYKSEETVRFKEGCLSYPKCTAWVKRHKSIVVSYKDENGVEQTQSGDGLFAIMAQHEIDHLDGKSLIDVVDPIEREKLYKQLNKSRK